MKTVHLMILAYHDALKNHVTITFPKHQNCVMINFVLKVNILISILIIYDEYLIYTCTIPIYIYILGCAKAHCPFGQVYLNSTSDVCVSKSKCKIPCKIEGSDRIFNDGDIVFEDDCHSWYI